MTGRSSSYLRVGIAWLAALALPALGAGVAQAAINRPATNTTGKSKPRTIKFTIKS